MQSLMQHAKMTRVLNAVGAGTSDQSCTILDMQGFEGVAFVALFGTISAGGGARIKVQQGNLPSMADAADFIASGVNIAAANDNDCVWAEIIRPSKRYVRAVVDRGFGSPAGNSVIDGVMAFQFGTNVPVTHDATTVAGGERHLWPIEGTA